MKNKGLIIGLITFLSVIVILLSVFFVLLLNGKIGFKNLGFFTKKSKTVIEEKEFSDTFDSINISSDVSDITFKVSKTNDIRVVVYGDRKEDKVNFKKDDDTLNITYKSKKCRFICMRKYTGSIEVYVPDNYSKNITIENDTGDIEINSGRSIRIRNDVGDIKIKNVDKYLSIRNDVGDIKITNLNITSDSSIRNDVGDITIENASNIKFDAKTDVGEKEIKGNDKKSDITLEIRNDVGDIEVN